MSEQTIEELKLQNEEYRKILIELRDSYSQFGLISAVMHKVITILDPHRKPRNEQSKSTH